MKAIATRPPIEETNTIRPRARRKRRQQRLGDGDLTEHVDLELPAQILRRDELERPAEADASVVDERVQAGPGRAAGAARPSPPTRAAASAICPASVTSRVSGIRRPPSPRRPAAPRRLPESRTPASTVQPDLARRSAVARPIPVEAPVMRARDIAATLTHHLYRPAPRRRCEESHRRNGAAAYACAQMVAQVRRPSSAARATMLVVLAALAGCGSGSGGSSTRSRGCRSAAKSCPATVVGTLGRVVRRVYHEGISSERTAVAERTDRRIDRRCARPSNAATPPRARAAATTLVAERADDEPARQAAADARSPTSAAPRSRRSPGRSTGPGGSADRHLRHERLERQGLPRRVERRSPKGRVVLRRRGRSIGGSLALPPGKLPPEGTLVLGQRPLPVRLASGARAFPKARSASTCSGPSARRRRSAGPTAKTTTFNTLSRVARLIYDGRGRPPRTSPQIRRVQSNAALLRSGRPRATRRLRGSPSKSCSTSTSCACACQPAEGCWPTSAARTCWRPSARRCGSADARSAASCSRSRTTRATCA